MNREETSWNQAEAMAKLHRCLLPARKRLSQRIVLQRLGPALLIGSGSAVFLALLKTVLPAPLMMAAAALPLILVPLLAVWLTVKRPPPWQWAAAAVDRHERLDDRALTALRLLSKSRPRPIDVLQIQETLARLGGVDAGRAVRPVVPRTLVAGAILLVLAVGFIVWPLEPFQIESPPPAGPPKPPPAQRPTAPGSQPAPAARPVPAGDETAAAPPTDWQPAPAGPAVVNRANLLPGPTLEQWVASQPKAAAAEGPAAEQPETDSAEPVWVPETIPAGHHRTVQRYFERIRPPLEPPGTQGE